MPLYDEFWVDDPEPAPPPVLPEPEDPIADRSLFGSTSWFTTGGLPPGAFSSFSMGCKGSKTATFSLMYGGGSGKVIAQQVGQNSQVRVLPATSPTPEDALQLAEYNMLDAKLTADIMRNLEDAYTNPKPQHPRRPSPYQPHQSKKRRNKQHCL